MVGNDEMVIPLNKKKLVLAILFAFAFVLPLGIWMFSLDPEFIQQFRRFNSLPFVHAVGFTFAVGGFLFVPYGIRRLFSNKPGLIFNNKGIVAYINGVGFIPWCEIDSAKIINMRSQQQLAIVLKEPQNFLGKRSLFRRTLLQSNLLLCDTPVVFSIGILSISPQELLGYFDKYQQKYGHA
jgi:hypothetical protein